MTAAILPQPTAPAVAPAGPALPWHWDKTSQALLAASLLGQTGDWLTTVDIARRPDEFHEQNPLLPAHPSVGRVNTQAGLIALGELGIASALPPGWRKGFLAASALTKALAILHNRQLGLRFNLQI